MGAVDAEFKIAGDLLAITGVTAVALVMMFAAGPIERVLGNSGLNILNRLFGLILLAISLTSIMTSLRVFFPGLAA
jgi:multiple antibiotic resistance protein